MWKGSWRQKRSGGFLSRRGARRFRRADSRLSRRNRRVGRRMGFL